MKRWIALVLMAFCSSVLTASAEEASASETATEVPRMIAMQNAAGLDQALFDDIVAHVEKYVERDVKVVPAAEPPSAGTLDEAAEALTDALPSDAYCLIALVKMGPEAGKHGVVRPDLQVAALHTTALMPESGDADVYATRLKKESVRCVGLLAGLPPCVYPRCALYHYTDDAGLDRKGTSFCPPCLIKYRVLVGVESVDAPPADEPAAE